MFLKPNGAKQVHDPDRGDFLPEMGREIIEQQYWLRRLQDGDVVEFDPTQTKEVK